MMDYRQIRLRRYREIIAVFTKHGFGMLFRRFKFPHPDSSGTSENAEASAGKRLRLALDELGPAFVKLGQILSIRPDILPAEITEELKKLQDSVQPFPFSEAKELIENEFNDKLEHIYQEFDENPLAAASISQVHRARLFSGTQVAVKVQRPGIEQTIDLDLDILKSIAHLLDRRTKYGQFYDFNEMVADFERTIKAELDFTKEGENADTFMRNLSRDQCVTVPKVKWIYTTKRVLTMEYFDGTKISDLEALDWAGIDRKKVAETLAVSVCNQILRDGFFHADPHPGNIQVLDDGTIAFLDLGMVGRLSEVRKRAVTTFFIGVVYRDSQMVVDAIVDMDAITIQSDMKNFRKNIDGLIGKYLTMPMGEMKIDVLLGDIFRIAFANHVKTPSDFALLAKTLGTLQGVLEKLDPEINALTVAEPIARKLLYQSFSFHEIGGHLKKSFLEFWHLFDRFPAAVRNILRRAENEEFTIQFEMKEMDTFQRRLERIANRMSVSVILLAVSIIIAGVVISSGLSADTSTEMYVFNLAVLKTGLALAVVLVLGLTISMIRSSR
jgi:ubiquinone biosynthesis protein